MLISPEERQEMSNSLERLLLSEGTEEHVRKAMETKAGYDTALWAKMAEYGFLGLAISPEFGGIGGGAREIEALSEVLGSKLHNSPFLVSSIFAASLISKSSSDELRKALLPKIGDGTAIVSVAYTGEAGKWDRSDVDVSANVDGSACILNGTASYTIYGHVADHLLVLAEDKSEIGVFLVDAKSPGVAIEELPANDPALRISRVDLNDAPAISLEGLSEADLDDAFDLALIGLAGEQAGGARAIFDITVEYLKTRHQFGRPIGSYQALKHMAADMLLDVESATSAAREAASAYANAADDADELLSLAAFACADAYRSVSAEAIQLHGGIAYTMEHPAHLYWRRARTGLWLFGSCDQHRENYLSILETAA